METLIREIGALIQTHPDKISFDDGNENNALDAYVQRIEDYLEALEDMTATFGRMLKGLRRKQRYFEDLAREAEAGVKQFLQEGSDQLAQAALARQGAMRQASEVYRLEWEQQHARFLALLDAKLRLAARLTEVSQRRLRAQAISSR